MVAACAEPRRRGNDGTWITPGMAAAYSRLYREGHAHSVECWLDGRLAGGLYGVAMGRVFFGESMFSRRSDASKVGLVQLCRSLGAWGFGLIDCQVLTGHLLRMGAEQIPRADFVTLLNRLCSLPGHRGPWNDGRLTSRRGQLPADEQPP